MVAVLDRARTGASSQRTSSQNSSFRPDVEGLRAVAVTLVVLYHAGVGGLSGGYVGVDVFFVISGYLITGLLLREHERTGRISFRDFYARRARRILPLASLVLLATIGGAAVLLTSSRLDAIAKDGSWTSIFAANVHFAASGADYLNATAPPSPLQHYWSLAVEEQFYVVWPLVLLVALRLFRVQNRAGSWRVLPPTGLLVAISLWWSIHQTAQNANAAYFSAFTRAWELGFGALVALGAPALSRLPRTLSASLAWVGLAAVGVAAVVYSTGTPFPGVAALLPVAGAAAVIAGGERRVIAGPAGVLSLRPMRALGRYSYALYLWHWPLIVIVAERYPGLGVGPKLALVGFALVLSAVGYRYFENPLRRSWRLTRSATVSIAFGLACILATLAYAQMVIVGHRAVVARAEALYAAQQKEARGSNTVVKLATDQDVRTAVAEAAKLTGLPRAVTPPLDIAARDIPNAYKTGCLVDTGPTQSPPCVSGDTAATRTVVLLGDSHAVQWQPALEALAARRDLRVVTLAKHSCPVADVRTYDGIVKRYYDECVSWRRWAYQRIAGLHPDTVIASETLEALVDRSGRQVPGSELTWQLGLRKSLAALAGVAAHVYLLADTPRHTQSAPECLARGNAAACSTPRAAAVDAAHLAQDRASAEAAGAHFVPTTDWFCTPTTCPSVIAGRVTDADDNHMTATYATYLSHVLGVATGLESTAQSTQTLGGVNAGEIEASVAAAIKGAKPDTITPPTALAATDFSPAYKDGCLVDAPRTTSPDCTFGDPSSDQKVVLLGDSHAAQWMPALLDSESRHSFALTVLTKGNCPASIMSVYSVELRRAFTECDTWRTNALHRIQQLKPQLVVVSSSFHGLRLATGGAMQSAAVERAWEEGLSRLIVQLRAMGTRVAVLSDVAVHAQPIPACVEAHANDLLACATPTVNAILVPHQLTEQKVVRASGATYVDVRPWLCTRTGCPAVVAGIVTDFDDSHLTATYSRYLGHALGVALRLE